MDSYNRGYGVGVKGLGGLQTYIGMARLIQESDVAVASPGVSAGFYAIAYNMTGVTGFAAGERAISYRGTDANLGGRFGPSVSLSVGGAGNDNAVDRRQAA